MNRFGTIYCTSIFGESHGIELGVVIDGVPSGIPFTEEDLKESLTRRQAGAIGTTSRKEGDVPHIVSGTFSGYTTGAPLTILFKNENTRSTDYNNLIKHPRPGHADFVAHEKFGGFSDYRGGGHFSGRVTLGVVASGTLASKILLSYNITISSKLIALGGESDKSRFAELIKEAMSSQDSLGGVVECRIGGMPVGVGEPFFGSVESIISHAIFSMPAVRGIEFGEGFEASSKKGSHHNDPIIDSKGKTSTNNAGGVNGGITNGNDIIFRVAVKPTASISQPQMTYNFEHNAVEELKVKGRHDACIVLRTPVIIESLAAMSLLDLTYINKFRKG